MVQKINKPGFKQQDKNQFLAKKKRNRSVPPEFI